MPVTKEEIDQLLTPLVTKVFDDGRAGMKDKSKRALYTGSEQMDLIRDVTGSTDGFDVEAFNFDAAGRVQRSAPEKVLERNWSKKPKYAELRVGKLEIENILLANGPIPRDITAEPRVMGRAYEIFMERVAADAFNFGFTPSGQTPLGFDSVGLFSNSHAIGGSTVDNLATLALTKANAETVIDQLDALQDAKGNVAGFVADTLMVPMALQNAGWTIANELNAGGNPTYANARIQNVIANPYLTDADAWFVMDSAAAKEHLLFRLHGGPGQEGEVESYIDHSTRSVVWQMGRSFDFNWTDPRFVVGSNP